jgi:hypothetical protein
MTPAISFILSISFHEYSVMMNDLGNLFVQENPVLRAGSEMAGSAGTISKA